MMRCWPLAADLADLAPRGNRLGGEGAVSVDRARLHRDGVLLRIVGHGPIVPRDFGHAGACRHPNWAVQTLHFGAWPARARV